MPLTKVCIRIATVILVQISFFNICFEQTLSVHSQAISQTEIKIVSFFLDLESYIK